MPSIRLSRCAYFPAVLVILALLCVFPLPQEAIAGPGDLDPTFKPNADGLISSAVVDQQGRVLLAGGFTNIDNFPSPGVAEINVAGGLNGVFGSGVPFAFCTLSALDGSTLVGGTFATVDGKPHANLARFQPGGVLDPAFQASTDSSITGLGLQPDGKVIAVGGFSKANGQPRHHIARFNPDGSLDPSFAPQALGDSISTVLGLAIQPDGKVIFWGIFTNLAGAPRQNIGRVDKNGVIDPGFAPSVDDTVDCALIEPDGQILIGGIFRTVNGIPRSQLALLDTNGILDRRFNPDLQDSGAGVYSMALQANGAIVIGGSFTTTGAKPLNNLARLSDVGSLDTSFNASVNDVVTSVSLQADGSLLVGGNFTSVEGQARNHFARLKNDPTFQNLSVTSTNAVWLRSGTFPEATTVIFELSRNGGKTWTALGQGIRLPKDLGPGVRFDSSWVINSNLPFNGLVRVSASTVGGQFNGAAGLVQTIGAVPTPDLAVEQPEGTFLVSGSSTIDYGTLLPGVTVDRTFTIRNVGTADLVGLTISVDGTNASDFALISAPTNTLASGGSNTFTMRLTGGVSGTKIARLRIASNDPDHPNFDLNLTGFVPFANLVVEQPTGNILTNGSAVNLGTIPEGGTGDLAFTIRNTGPIDLTDIVPTLIGPDASLFSIVATPAQPVANTTGSTTMVLRYTPTSPGTNHAKLSIHSSDPNHDPFDIQLVGNSPIVDAGFGPKVTDEVTTEALQPDGRILIAGRFTQIAGSPRTGLARLNPDGSLDTAFNPTVDGPVNALAVRADGRILIGGQFSRVNGVGRGELAQLNPDGSLDTRFKLDADGLILCLAVQPDGKVLVGGNFFNLGTVARNRMARFNPDGTLDLGFDPNVDGLVRSLAVQADGGVVLCGFFATVGNTPSSHLARVNSDGKLDLGFKVPASISSSVATLQALAVQPDGRILVTTDNTLASGALRVNPDGSVDTSYHPPLNGKSVVLQTDGNAVYGGGFQSVGPTGANIARVLVSGVEDSSFFATADSPVNCLALQPDGKILLGGRFTTINSQTAGSMARLDNSFATESLTATSESEIVWLRGGTSPEAQSVTFELSTDGGVSFNALGAGTRTNGGWSLGNITLPTDGLIRARARTVSGQFNGSASLVESIAAIHPLPLAPQIVVESPAGSRIKPVQGKLVFDASPVGTNGPPAGVIIRNLGTAPLVVTNVTLASGDLTDFTLDSNGLVTNIPPGSQSTFLISFTPTSAGPKTTTLRISSNDASLNPFDIAVFGAFPFPRIVIEQPPGDLLTNGVSVVDFGPNIATGHSADLAVTIRNQGSGDLTNIVLGITGPNASEFSVATDPLPSVIPPGNTATVAVRLSPLTSGTKTATLEVDSNDPRQSAFTLGLTAAVPFPKIRLEEPLGEILTNNRAVVDFGSVTNGGTVDLTFTVENIGPSDLTGLGLGIDGSGSGSYSVIANPVAPVTGPSGSTTFTVRYSPIRPGTNQAALHLASNDPQDNPFNIQLTGFSPVFDTNFAPNPSAAIVTIAIQPDEKILVAGRFTQIGGELRSGLARLKADGSVDLGFAPTVDAPVNCLAVRSDGRIVLGGQFSRVNGISRVELAQLNADGSLDTSFALDAGGLVLCLAVQPDGKILVGGNFTALGPVARNRLGRINPDGSLDLGFNPNVDDTVRSIAVQSDGAILISGNFASVGGTSAHRLARVASDGSPDTNFKIPASLSSSTATLQAVAVQLDGKILVATDSPFNDGAIRLNADGSLDPTYHPTIGGNCVVLQTDGNAIYGGAFAAFAPGGANIARALPAGTTDPTFLASVDSTVNAVALQPDGKVLIGGQFTSILGQPIGSMARLNNDLAPQSLVVTNPAQLLWLRSGAAPEAQFVTFDVSTDGGASFATLGNGVRTNGGWVLAGLNLPANGLIRARARTVSGRFNGSSSLIETVASLGVPPLLFPALTVASPKGSFTNGLGSVDFGEGTVGNPGPAQNFIIRNTGKAPLLISRIRLAGPDTHDFVLNTSGIITNLPPGAATTISVAFSPANVGGRRTVLEIESNDSNEPLFTTALAGGTAAILPGTDTIRRPPGRSVQIVAATLLANDISRLNKTLSVAGVSARSANGGSVSLLDDHSLVYTPAPDSNASDTFNYLVTDGTSTVSCEVQVVVETQTGHSDFGIGIALTSPDVHSEAPAVSMGTIGIPLHTYLLQFATDLNPPVLWTDLGIPLSAGPDGQVILKDFTPQSPRIYRIVEGLIP